MDSIFGNKKVDLLLYIFYSPVLNGMREADRDYYNDLPGKVPPDIGPPPVPPLPNAASTLPNLKHHSTQNQITRCNPQNSILHDTCSIDNNRQLQQWTGNFIIKKKKKLCSFYTHILNTLIVIYITRNIIIIFSFSFFFLF